MKGIVLFVREFVIYLFAVSAAIFAIQYYQAGSIDMSETDIWGGLLGGLIASLLLAYLHWRKHKKTT